MYRIFNVLLLTLLLSLNPLGAQTMTNFVLKSKAFSNNSMIPTQYTCDGKDISPDLEWTGAPANTRTFALILVDVDAPLGNFYHWVLYNIPLNVSKLEEGLPNPPSGLTVGQNSWSKQQYNGPCPPKGKTHRYYFKLYAIDTAINLAAGADVKTLMTAINNHILGQAELSATFSH